MMVIFVLVVGLSNKHCKGDVVKDQSIDFVKLQGKYQFLHALKDLPYVEKVLLFGSRARGTAQERSDIDLAIVSPRASVKE